MSIFLDKNNLKIMCPELFDPELATKLRQGMVVDFNTSTMISSKRSLLKELSDEGEEEPSFESEGGEDYIRAKN